MGHVGHSVVILGLGILWSLRIHSMGWRPFPVAVLELLGSLLRESGEAFKVYCAPFVSAARAGLPSLAAVKLRCG